MRSTPAISAAHESVQNFGRPKIGSPSMLGTWLRSGLALLTASVILVLWAGAGAGTGTASAATVIILGHNGRTHKVENRFLTGAAADPALPAAPAAGPFLSLPGDPPSLEANDSPSLEENDPPSLEAGDPPSLEANDPPSLEAGDDPLSITTSPLAQAARAAHASPRDTVATAPSGFPAALATLMRTGQIPGASYRNDLRIWNAAIAEEGRLTHWRSAQLTDVTALLQELAARRQVTAGRLPALIVMLNRNAQYWRTGARLAYPDRVQFAGSELVWEYYPGYGLQFQVLGTFGEGDGYYEAGPADYPKLVQLMSEVNQLAVKRAGGIAWEYYFNWEGGKPPWVSAMAQATGIEALTDAYLATGNHAYLDEAHDALPLFERSPPSGTAVAAAAGTEFLQYSFAPKTDIINAYLQTLLGLYDYEQASLDPTALALFNSGNTQAQRVLPSFIISGWSLYQPGEPDNLNYHELVTGFLKLLCQKTSTPVYCSTYTTFSNDLVTKPSLAQVTIGAVSGKSFKLQFALSKYAAVGVTLSRGSKNYLYTKRDFYAGTDSFKTPALKPGTYNLTMSATDPAGNYARITGQVQVCSGSCPPYSIKPPTTSTTTTGTSTSTTTTGTATTTTTSTTPTTATTPTTTTTTTTTSTTITATTPTTSTPGGGSSGL